MKNIERRSDRTIFGSFLGGQFLLPLISIALFQHFYAYSPRVIVGHLLIVGFAYLLLFGITVLLCSIHQVRGRRAARYLLPLAWGTCTVGLYYTYLLAWGGRLSNGMNMRLPWVTPYLLHPSAAISTFSISPVVYWGILAGIPVAILAGYLAAARPFAAAEMRLLARTRQRWRTSRSRWRAVGVLALAMVVLSVGMNAAVSNWVLHPSADHFFGDPIFVSLFEENSALPLAGVGNANVAYSAPAQFQKKNVILIVLDACRADHLGMRGYRRDTTPFLDSLQRSGHLRVVHSFYSASCCTFGGIMTMLRSRYWFKMTLHGFALQDVLKRAGYKVHLVLSGDHSNFTDLKSCYGPNVDSFSDGLDKTRHFTFNDDRGLLETSDQLPSFDGTPSFLYFHLMSVHYMGKRLASTEVYKPDMGEWNEEIYGNHYDNGLIQADQDLDTLFAGLKQKGYLENSIIVITGDHGESIGEHGSFGHGHNLYNEEVQPPLMIYDPDPVTYQNLEFARQVDVAPTILDRLGLPIPSCWDGCSLLRPETPRFSYLRIGDTYAVLDHSAIRTLKYIYDARTKKEELYDDTRDPSEQQNILATADARELGELRTAVGAFSVHPGT